MKRGAIIILLVLCISLISLVSAATEYECSNGSTLLEDRDEIQLNDRRSINGLGLGLTFADETTAIGTYRVNLITGAQKFQLTDSEPAVELTIKGEELETITMHNLSLEKVKLDVSDKYEEIEKGDTDSVGEYLVFIGTASGEYPNATANVVGIIGDEELSLDQSQISQIITFDEIDYVLELFAASDSNAIITVKKCEDENDEIVEVQEEEPEPEVNDTVIDLTDGNETADTNETTEEENVTTTEEDTSQEEVEPAEPKMKTFSTKNIILTIIAIIVIIVVVGLIAMSRKKQKGGKIIEIPSNPNQ